MDKKYKDVIVGIVLAALSVIYLLIAVAVSAAIYVLFNHVFMLILPKAGWF